MVWKCSESLCSADPPQSNVVFLRSTPHTVEIIWFLLTLENCLKGYRIPNLFLKFQVQIVRLKTHFHSCLIGVSQGPQVFERKLVAFNQEPFSEIDSKTHMGEICVLSVCHVRFGQMLSRESVLHISHPNSEMLKGHLNFHHFTTLWAWTGT